MNVSPESSSSPPPANRTQEASRDSANNLTAGTARQQHESIAPALAPLRRQSVASPLIGVAATRPPLGQISAQRIGTSFGTTEVIQHRTLSSQLGTLQQAANNRLESGSLASLNRNLIQGSEAAKDALAKFDLTGRLHLIPSGFESYLDKGFTLKQMAELRRLMDGPSEAEKAEQQQQISMDRGKMVPKLFGAQIGLLWNNQAGVDQWRSQIEDHLVSLNTLLASGISRLDRLQARFPSMMEQCKLKGEDGEIVRIPFRNAVLQDILVLTANERAQLESSGVSTLFRPGDIPPGGTPEKNRPLEMKRFVGTSDMLRHVEATHQQISADIASGLMPEPVRNRVTFALGSLLHVVTAELRTTARNGKPVTVLFCVDGSSASEVAMELKSLMDIQKQRDVVAMVINTHSQSSVSDCPIYAMFHADKLRAMSADPGFDLMLDRLLDGEVSPAAYKLPWGSEDGSKVYFIENDSHPKSRLIPPSILKEMQSKTELEKLTADRQWQHLAVNKKGQSANERYDASYVGVRGMGGRSTSMVDKAIKYFTRARHALDNIAILYGKQEGDRLLQRMLAAVRTEGRSAPVPAEERVATIRHFIKMTEGNIAWINAQTGRLNLSHQRYLIEKELVDEDDDDEGSIDLADTGKVAEYARMTDHELEALDQELHRQEKLLLGKQQAATDDSGRPEGLSGKMLEALEITAESEAVRLAQLQALLRLFAQRQSFRSGDGFVLRA